MSTIGKPHYALLGRRESYSMGNRQAKKHAIFEEALAAIHHYINNPNFVSIPHLVAAIYDGDDPQLNPIREALKSNSLFQFTTCLSASGQKILAYLAVWHDKKCLKENGDINLNYTKQIIRSFFSYETQDTIQFDDSAIRNLKATDTHFQFSQKRFAYLNLPFSREDSRQTIQKKLQTDRLFQAFQEKDHTGVQQALHAGAIVNSEKERGGTPLMFAIYNGWLDVAQDLLPKSSAYTINAVNRRGYTALFYACQNLTDIPFLTQLLARSSDKIVNTISEMNYTALLIACQKLRDIPFLTQLLARSSLNTVNAVTPSGQTALLIACKKLTDIPFLTKLRVDSSEKTINTVNESGYTALSLACKKLTDIPFLTKLLERSFGGTVNMIDKHAGHTPLLLACHKLTDIPFLTQLLARSSDTTVNAVSNRGRTALITLVYKPNNHETVQQLLPLLLPRLTRTNFRSAYQSKNMVIAKTAWQIAHEYGPGPWEIIARSIGKAMRALRDTTSPLSFSLAEYAASHPSQNQSATQPHKPLHTAKSL